MAYTELCWKARSSTSSQCRGSDAQWYKNVQRTRRFGLMDDAWRQASEPTPVTNAKAVKSVVEKFREKYGAKDVKKCYSSSTSRLC